MVRIDIRYEGELHCAATHAPSGASLATDAPVDNHGRGESFSPTDLLATGLGCCMLTVMGILAQERGFPYGLEGTSVRVEKLMTPPPRRVARLEVVLDVPTEGAQKLDAAQRSALEQRANECPVRLSILPAIDVPITFNWGA